MEARGWLGGWKGPRLKGLPFTTLGYYCKGKREIRWPFTESSHWIDVVCFGNDLRKPFSNKRSVLVLWLEIKTFKRVERNKICILPHEVIKYVSIFSLPKENVLESWGLYSKMSLSGKITSICHNIRCSFWIYIIIEKHRYLRNDKLRVLSVTQRAKSWIENRI